MDCEKFDSHVIDELYDELDEVTHAAMKRHAEGCARCGGLISGLRATREVGVLPLVEPSDDFEDRILAAAAAAQRKAPFHKKLWRGVAWAGSHAMRPQLAMAAVFVLCIGASLVLLRGPGSGPVRVTERGEPVVESEAPQAVAEPPAAAAPTAAAVAGAERGDEQRVADGRAKEKRAAEGADTAADVAKDKDAAAIALSEARSVRSQSGCSAAVSKFDDVGVRFAGTAAAADAMWEAAACHKQMGNQDKARELYLALRGYGAYKDRADAELALAEANQMGNSAAPGGGGSQHSAAAPRKAAAKPKAVAVAPFDSEAPAPAAPAPAPPPQSSGASGGGKAPASQVRKVESGL
jgi:hypothetical protein